MQQQPFSNNGSSSSAWNRGPPPQSISAETPSPSASDAHYRNGNNHANSATTTTTPQQQRVGRVHHNLSAQDAQIHAYQLSVAQQMAMAALAQGRDLASFQLDVARANGVDERALHFQLEPFTVPLTGNEPQLGLTLIRDDEAYTHIELLMRYPHLASINFLRVDLKLMRGNLFLAMCAKEAQVHEALKYGYWMLPNSAQGEVDKLNALFAEQCGIAPIYLLVACLDSCAFAGVAEMVAPATPAEPGPNNKYANMQRVPIRFVMCKNVPFSALPFLNLFHQQGLLLQPLRNPEAARALSQYARYPMGTSVLMDFKHFDEAEARGVEGESGEAAIRAANKARAFAQARRNHHQQQQQNAPRERSKSARPPQQQQQQQQQAEQQPQYQKWLLSANEERVTLPSKIVYEITAKKSNKERKQEAKQRLLEEQQRRREEEEEEEEVVVQE